MHILLEKLENEYLAWPLAVQMSEDSSEEAYKSPLVIVAGNKEIQIVENSIDAADKDKYICHIDRRLCNQAL